MNEIKTEFRLYKKTGTYFSKEKNKDVPFTNFYIKANDELIPIEVKYFPNPKTDNRDLGYSKRMAILSFIAETLPDKDKEAPKQEATNDELPL